MNDGMTGDSCVVKDEYVEEGGYVFEDNDIETDTVKVVQSEKQENAETPEIYETSNKSAVVVIALVGTLAFLWSVADRNGFDVFDWVKSKFSKKPKEPT